MADRLDKAAGDAACQRHPYRLKIVGISNPTICTLQRAAIMASVLSECLGSSVKVVRDFKDTVVSPFVLRVMFDIIRAINGLRRFVLLLLRMGAP